MGLQSTIQSLVGTAFNAIGDLKETVDYTHEGQEPDYDPTTGLVTSDSATVTVQVEAVFVAIKSTAKTLPTDLVEVALPGDYVALIPGIQLSIKPTTGDTIVRLDETWVVKGMSRDPAKGLWIILVRRQGGGADSILVFHE